VKHLLDTDHIVILQRQQGAEYVTLSARLAQHSASDIGLSLVSFHEQVLGCHTFISRAKKTSEIIRGYGMLGRVLQHFARSPVLPFDAPAVAVYESLRAQRLKVATMDLRIAATALHHRLILVARNTRDFQRVPGIVIEDWTV
jgi:tRNA(fMet)-specific endonuclease VapC